MYITTLYAFLEMYCIYIKRKDIHEVLVIYFDSLRIFYGLQISQTSQNQDEHNIYVIM